MAGLIPPEAAAGFLRGLWQAFLAGGLAFLAVDAGTPGDVAIRAGFTVFFSVLAARTGEGIYDAKQNALPAPADPSPDIDAVRERIRTRVLPPALTPEEMDLIARVRSGEVTWEPNATPPPEVRV